MIFKQR